MSRPSRATFVQFGVNSNGAADICQYGSPATGSPVYTKVIATLQALTAWTTGWAAETVANNRPFLEDMNAVDFVFSYMINYILTLGIAEYDVGTTYFVNSICQYNGVLYQCINDNSGAGISGQLPTNATYWALLIPPIFSTQNSVVGSRAVNTIYQNTTGKIMFVTMSGVNSGMGGSAATVYTDSSSSPSTEVAYEIFPPLSGASIYFMVIPGNYYEISGNPSSITSWTEVY